MLNLIFFIFSFITLFFFPIKWIEGLNDLVLNSSFFVLKPNQLFEVIMWPLNLPLPCSDQMNGLTELYLNSMNINASILVAVVWLMIEALKSSIPSKATENTSVEDKKATSKENPEKVFYFYGFPIHFEVWEEHLIDIFAIVVPTLIVLNQIVPTLGFLYNEEFLFYEKIISFQVNVIGNQWFWTYEYLIDLKIDDESFINWVDSYTKVEPVEIFFTFNSVLSVEEYENRLLDVDKSLVLPVHTNVLFSFTSRDVIHSWALPQMGIKVDCVPGRVTSTIFNSYSLGVFYGQCSELCGPLHGFMPICVEILLPDYFVLWALLETKMYSSSFDFSYYDIVKQILHVNQEVHFDTKCSIPSEEEVENVGAVLSKDEVENVGAVLSKDEAKDVGVIPSVEPGFHKCPMHLWKKHVVERIVFEDGSVVKDIFFTCKDKELLPPSDNPTIPSLAPNFKCPISDWKKMDIDHIVLRDGTVIRDLFYECMSKSKS